jgi:hypothetical protein
MRDAGAKLAVELTSQDTVKRLLAGMPVEAQKTEAQAVAEALGSFGQPAPALEPAPAPAEAQPGPDILPAPGGEDAPQAAPDAPSPDPGVGGPGPAAAAPDHQAG